MVLFGARLLPSSWPNAQKWSSKSIFFLLTFKSKTFLENIMQEEKRFGAGEYVFLGAKYVLMGLAYFMALKYFFGIWGGENKQKTIDLDASGRKFNIIVSDLERLPVNKELPRLKINTEDKGKTISVATNLCLYRFDSKTAALESILYKSIKDKQGSWIDSLRCAPSQQETFCQLPSLTFLPFTNFLPPFSYVEKRDFENSIELEFATQTPYWHLKKIFVLQKDAYTISLKIISEPKGNHNRIIRKPRLVFFAPTRGSESTDKDKALAVASNEQFIFDKVSESDDAKCAWKKPYLFGGEDRFFLHCLMGAKAQSPVVRGYYHRFNNNSLAAILELAPITGIVEHQLDFYFGPKKIADLATANKDLENVLSFGWLSGLCKLLLFLLEFLNGFIKNFGYAIVLLALVIRIPFLPLSIFGRFKTRRLDWVEKKYAGEIADINRRYSNNTALRYEQLGRFYAEHNVSQWSRLFIYIPELLQLPIIFALYRVLTNYVSLYHAPFAWWINDLSAKDPYFVLPVLMGLCFFLQQAALSPVPQERGTVIKYLPAIFMVVVFANFPAGIVLYWLSKMVFSILEEVLFRLMGLGNLQNNRINN